MQFLAQFINIPGVTGMMQKMAEFFGTLQDKIDGIDKSNSKIKVTILGFKTLGQVFKDAKGNVTSFFDSLFTGTDKANSKLSKLNEVRSRPSIGFASIGSNQSSVNPFPLVKGLTASQKQQLKDMETEMLTVRDLSEEMKQVVVSSFSDMASGIGESIGNILTSVGSVNSMLNTILDSLAKFVSNFGKMLVAYGAASLAFHQALLNPIAAIVAGTALVAIGTAIHNLVNKGPKVPKMANGGLAFGESLVTVGDYMNSSTNPEVISPLNTLKGLLGGQTLVIEPQPVYLDGKEIYRSQRRIERLMNK